MQTDTTLLQTEISPSVLAALHRFAYSHKLDVRSIIEFALGALLLSDDEPMQWEKIERDIRESGFDRCTRLLVAYREKGAESSLSESSSRKSTNRRGTTGGPQVQAHVTNV